MANASAIADEIGTVADLVNVKTIAATIRESAQHVLAVALAREGIAATPEQIATLAREIGNNAAFIVGVLEVG
jgi:hypothetical protein